MPKLIKKRGDIAAGDYYEDCFFHPCACIRVDGDEVNGISLVDGSYPRACSISHCGIRKLTFREALHWKFFGPPGREIPEKDRWWHGNPKAFWPEDELLKPFRLDTTRKPNTTSEATV